LLNKKARKYNAPNNTSRCEGVSLLMTQGAGIDRARQLHELNIFHDVAKALTSSLNLDSILQTIMEKVAEYFRPDTWSLLMVDEPKDELYFAIAVGDAAEALKTVRLKMGEGIAGWVARHGEPLIVPDVYKDPRFAKRIDEMTKWKTRSIVCMPLKSRQRVLGVIQLINVGLSEFEENEIFFLNALCDYAAIAIENARAVRRVQELSITDTCTGLYNARHLFTVLAEEVHRSKRFGYEFSLLFIDLDHFKRVNDEHGHLIGSKLLGEFGQSLRDHLRLVDVAFRYGGDEFAVLLPQTSKEAALFVARRLMAVFHTTGWLPDKPLSVALRASVGIACYPADATTPEALVQLADEMMYQVKQAGRDNISVTGMGIMGWGLSR
jgi:diguanylate cyclase (GGDEF)-like protein